MQELAILCVFIRMDYIKKFTIIPMSLTVKFSTFSLPGLLLNMKIRMICPAANRNSVFPGQP